MEPSTWASEQPLKLGKDDQRMLYASRAPSDRGCFQPRATALESMLIGGAAAAASAATVLAGDVEQFPGLEAWQSVQAFLADPDAIAEDAQGEITSQSTAEPEGASVRSVCRGVRNALKFLLW